MENLSDNPNWLNNVYLAGQKRLQDFLVKQAEEFLSGKEIFSSERKPTILSTTSDSVLSVIGNSEITSEIIESEFPVFLTQDSFPIQEGETYYAVYARLNSSDAPSKFSVTPMTYEPNQLKANCLAHQKRNKDLPTFGVIIFSDVYKDYQTAWTYVYSQLMRQAKKVNLELQAHPFPQARTPQEIDDLSM